MNAFTEGAAVSGGGDDDDRLASGTMIGMGVDGLPEPNELDVNVKLAN